MKLKSFQYLLAFLLAFVASANAWATVTCTASNISYSPTYVPTVTTTNTLGLSFTVICVRDNTGSNNADVSYTVTTNNGIHIGAGTQNRALDGVNPMNYEFFKNSDCTVEFTGTNTFGATIVNMPKNSTSAAATYNFTGCIPAQQVIAGLGPYTDTVGLIVTTTASATGGVANGPGSVAVSINTPSICVFDTNPGNIVLNYTAFQGTAARQTSLYKIKCSGSLPFSSRITDVNNTVQVKDSVAAGVNYSLGLSGTSNGAPGDTLSGTGNGLAQDGYIIVTIPANQAGSCSGGCSATNTHYLTLTY